MSVPKIIFVQEVKERDGETYLVASRNIQEAMTDVPHGERRVVGVYKIFARRHLINVVKPVKEIKVR